MSTLAPEKRRIERHEAVDPVARFAAIRRGATPLVPDSKAHAMYPGLYGATDVMATFSVTNPDSGIDQLFLVTTTPYQRGDRGIPPVKFTGKTWRREVGLMEKYVGRHSVTGSRGERDVAARIVPLREAPGGELVADQEAAIPLRPGEGVTFQDIQAGRREGDLTIPTIGVYKELGNGSVAVGEDRTIAIGSFVDDPLVRVVVSPEARIVTGTYPLPPLLVARP